MDYKYHQIICKLKVLSKVERDEKIIIHNDNIEILNCTNLTFFNRLRKLWRRETRKTTADKLKNLYQDIVDLTNKLTMVPSLESDAVIEDLHRLANEIEKSLKGLDNLMVTYGGDKTIKAEFEAMRENFLMKIKKIRLIEQDHQYEEESEEYMRRSTRNLQSSENNGRTDGQGKRTKKGKL